MPHWKTGHTRLTETAAQSLYRKAHAEGASDILEFVLGSLEGLEWAERGTSSDTILSAIRLVKKIQRHQGDIIQRRQEEQEKEREHRERASSALPLRTEEEIRKDRLHADKKIFTPSVDSGHSQA